MFSLTFSPARAERRTPYVRGTCQFRSLLKKNGKLVKSVSRSETNEWWVCVYGLALVRCKEGGGFMMVVPSRVGVSGAWLHQVPLALRSRLELGGVPFQ